MSVKDVAKQNFESHLKNNSYPGRGIVVGQMENGNDWIIIYFIMGRSVNSRNRRFVFKGDRLWTEPVDESKVSDPSLIIYDAMLALDGVQLVSNGDQTTTIHAFLSKGDTFVNALNTREREPDTPNFTPRISAMLNCNGDTPAVTLSVLAANAADTKATNRTTFTPAQPGAGLGYCLTTYMGDGNPLPSFNTMPLVMPISGSAEDVLEAYWSALDADNKVSLGVKQVDKTGKTVKIVIKNCHDE